MSVTIRDFDASLDADRVAELYRRVRYGSAARAGFPVDGRTLQLVLRQSGVRHFVVAEDDGGRIVGTVALIEVCDGHAAAPGEIFADHYIVDPAFRNSTLSGRLLGATFKTMMIDHVRAVRLRVDPTNKVAQRLYVRTGFRPVRTMRPDADGFVEMVNHLPGVLGVVGQLYAEQAPGGQPPEHFFTHFMRRMRTRDRPGRRGDADDGLLRYDFKLAGHHFRLHLDAAVGDVELFAIDGEDWTARAQQIQRSDFPLVPVSDPDQTRSMAIGDYTLTEDDRGLLTVAHPGVLGPVVVDPFPECNGRLVAPARPAVHTVRTAAHEGGWSSTSDEGAVSTTRILERLELGYRATITVTGQHDGDLVAAPRPTLRIAEHAALPAGAEQARADHLREGVWPLRLSGFEAAADESAAVPAQGYRMFWTDSERDLEVRVTWHDDGVLRPGGMCITNASQLSYSVEFCGTAQPAEPQPASEPAADLGRAVDETRGAQAVADDGSTVQLSRHGLESWTVGTTDVLRAPARRRTGFGPLRQVPAAAWPDITAPRFDPDCGGEWPDGTTEFLLLNDAAQPPATPDTVTWRTTVGADARSLAVDLTAPATVEPAELVLTLKPAAGCDALWLGDAADALCRFERGATSWRCWTRRVRVPISDDLVLDVVPLDADEPEILVRATPSGFLISAYSALRPGVAGHCTWLLRTGERSDGD